MILSDTANIVVGLIFGAWCIFLILVTLRGSKWLHKRSEGRDRSNYSTYERLVSYWMLFGAMLLTCMLMLLILSLIPA